MPIRLFQILTVFLFLTGDAAIAFSFAEEEEQERAEDQQAAQHQREEAYVSESCKKKLKNKKIAFIIGESHTGDRIRPTAYKNYGSHFQIINKQLRQYGMKTYSQEEINHQVAQEEIAAALNNDPDAALSAAQRLGASFILRGVISSRTHFNPIVRTNEVFVDMAFSLISASGRIIADATAGGDSWAGTDTVSVSLDIVSENAAQIVGRLYRDYCS